MASRPPPPPFLPGARTLGILGGGQLGMMLTSAAVRLGIRVVVLDPTPGCPAAQAGAAQLVGSFADAARIAELAARCDVVTAEIEHVDVAALQRAAGACRVEPAPATLALVQDKLLLGTKVLQRSKDGTWQPGVRAVHGVLPGAVRDGLRGPGTLSHPASLDRRNPRRDAKRSS
jgi:hypothetical protein